MPPERILITGGTGQLGRALQDVYAGDALVEAPSHADLDLTDVLKLRRVFHDFLPTLVIHAAAATNVDACEADVEGTFRSNALGTRYVAHLAALHDAPLVYISTNYVFSGSRDGAYHEWDETKPISVYGRSKLGGEREVERHARRHVIVRTSWLYGHEVGHRNFVRTMMRLAESAAGPLRVVADQFGQPTYASDLASAIRAIVATQDYGLFHLTNEGACSWYEWAQEIFRVLGRDVPLEPIPATDYPRPAEPPRNGLLANLAAASLGITLPEWRDGLRRCLAAMGGLSGGRVTPVPPPR